MSDVMKTTLLEAAESHHRKIRFQAKGSVMEALAAGRALLAAKAAAPGKRWLAVLRASTSMNPRTVQRYMLVARAMDAGLLEADVESMSFSHAYRLAVKQAVRAGRKTAAASASDPAAARVSQQAKAMADFRQATRAAIAAGVPLKKLEHELSRRADAEPRESRISAEGDAIECE